MNDDPHKNEWDDLVRRAHGYHIRPFTPGEKAGILWADAELKRLREAVEWAIGGYADTGVARGVFCSDAAYDSFRDELRRKAKG